MPDEGMTPPSGCPVLTVKGVAERLGISKKAVYAALKRGEMPFLKVGRRYAIPVRPLERVLAEQKGR